MPYVEVVPVVDPSVRELCRRPYSLHPRGCPKFGRVMRREGIVLEWPPTVTVTHVALAAIRKEE